MKYELKKNENSSVEVKIVLEEKEFNEMISAITSKISSEVEVAGFRKGKAPQKVVISNYKDSIKQDMEEKSINKFFPGIVTDEKILPVGHIDSLSSNLEENSFDVTFSIDVYPEIELGEYKGIKEEKGTFEMSDELLEKEIEFMLNSKIKLVDVTEEGYKAVIGDTLDLNFEGSIDGVPFPGGKADSYKLKLGTKSFIDTFEDQLVGYTIGQEGEVNVSFPEEYHAEELAGKPAVFKVKINAIQKEEIPKLDDELAKELGYESVEDLKAKKTDEITKMENDKIENEFESKLLSKIAESTKVVIPASMVNGEVEGRIREFEQQLSMQGASMDQYLKMTGSTMETMKEYLYPMSELKVKNGLILEEIAKLEKLEASDEELDEKMSEVAKSYGMEVSKIEEELNKNNSLENFKMSIKNEIVLKKALDLIISNAK